jgi:hypothetical protein
MFLQETHMQQDPTPQLTEHLIIRVTKEQKELLRRTAKSYGLKPTQLGRHLIASNLPHIQKNRFYESVK